MNPNKALLLLLMAVLPLLTAAQRNNSNRGNNSNSRNSTTTERPSGRNSTTTERPSTRNSTSSGELWKVDISPGSIEAPMTKDENGHMFYAFNGIPYAEPPVGELRFKPPIAAKSWTGVRDGSVESAICPQLDFMALMDGREKTVGEEDCLYLNVFVPRRNASQLPVMVWIHGGGFMLGSAKEYNPAPLLAKDVVVVVIQYRLGTLGFLSTEDSVMSGNNGLKDQIMALQWVKNNIQYFGGDPRRVTLFGESAGGISGSLLMHSPKAKDLFQRVIAQSGVALFHGTIRDNHRMVAMKVAEMLNCPNDTSGFNSQKFYDCLKNVSPDKLVMASNNFTTFSKTFTPLVMMPRVDGDVLPKHPAQMLKEGNYNKVNLMAGSNRDEGASVLRPLLMRDADLEEMARNFSEYAPIFLQMQDGPHSEYMAKRLFAHYLGEFNISEENADRVVKMITDYWFSIPLEMTGKMLSKEFPSQKVFLYELKHLGENRLFDSPKLTVGKNWVSHGDDLQYLFDFSLFKPLMDPIDIFMREIMVTLWTNFARTGNPTPDMSLGFKWSPVTKMDMQYLILQPAPYMRNSTRDMEMELITNLPMKQNQALYPERFVTEA